MNKVLTKKQQEAFDLIVKGKNIFLTGPSGTGKSVVIDMFKKLYGNQKNIAVTSTTGISALLIGGTTLHSFLGIGLGEGTVDDLIVRIRKTRNWRAHWQDTEVLIIDEISMLSPDLFDKLENVARILRRVHNPRIMKEEIQLPFGGLQIVLCGDFLQLPVVGEDKFCFESKSWNKCIDKTIYLTEIMRQSDSFFQSVLNDMRYGRVTKNVEKLIESRIGIELKNEMGIKPTKIFTTNNDVDYMNEKELDKLSKDNDFYEYEMDIYFYDFVKDREQAIEKCKKRCLAPYKLQLCVGAQVMLIYNLDLDSGLANGSRGVVTRFENDFPVVKFLNGEERPICYNSWEIIEDKKKQIRITQIPLRLAWSITVHKCQGCTLDCAEVDLSNLFAFGQAYVALSRVKTKDGLTITDINIDGIKAHPRAVEFYQSLD